MTDIYAALKKISNEVKQSSIFTFRLFFSSFFLIQCNACCCGSIQSGKRLEYVVRMPFWTDSSSGGNPWETHLGTEWTKDQPGMKPRWQSSTFHLSAKWCNSLSTELDTHTVFVVMGTVSQLRLTHCNCTTQSTDLGEQSCGSWYVGYLGLGLISNPLKSIKRHLLGYRNIFYRAHLKNFLEIILHVFKVSECPLLQQMAPVNQKDIKVRFSLWYGCAPAPTMPILCYRFSSRLTLYKSHIQ